MRRQVESGVAEIVVALLELVMQQDSGVMDGLRSCPLLVLTDSKERQKRLTHDRMKCVHASAMDQLGWCLEMVESKY